MFVFALTQVTTVLSDNPTWSGLGHALLILGALWWTWAAYAWLTNTVDPESAGCAGRCWSRRRDVRRRAGGPGCVRCHGVVFGVAFLIVTVMHLTLYALAARGDSDLLAAILRIAPRPSLGAG